MSNLAKVLDKDGNDTGEALSIGQLHSDSSLFCETSHIWMYDPGGWVLLQQRSKNHKSHPGKWDISVAGHVDFGETPEQAAIREIKEELGLAVKSNDLEFITRKYTENISQPSNVLHNQYTAIYLLRIDKKSTKPELLDGEVADLIWKEIGKFETDINDSRHLKGYVPHSSEYYNLVIAELKKRTDKTWGNYERIPDA